MSQATAPSWSMRRNLLQLARLEAEAGYHWVKEHYFALTMSIILFVAGLVALGMVFNSLGWYPLNLVLAAISILAGIVFFAQPAFIGVVFAAGPGIGGTRKKGLELYAKSVAHILVFAGMLFLVLGTIRIESYWAAFGLLVVLAIIGLLSFTEKMPAKIYYTVVMGMALVYAGLFIFGMTVYQHPQGETLSRAQRAEMIRQDQKEDAELNRLAEIKQTRELSMSEQVRWNELEQRQQERSTRNQVGKYLSGNGSQQWLISNLRPYMLKGIDVVPGWYTFEVKTGDVQVGDSLYALTTYVRINGKSAGERVYIGTSKTARMTYSFGGPVANAPLVNPQNVNVKFTPAP